MASTDLDLRNIGFQSNLRSKPIRQNYADIENNFNALRAEVYASIASTASEVVSARDKYDNLGDNIRARQGYGSVINTGGIVQAQGTPDNTVYVSTGAGICPNGVGVSWDGANSNTIGVVTKPRYIVTVINSDNTLSLELGATSDDPVLPELGKTQRALGGFLQSTASPVVINNSAIWDMRRQGCNFNGKYFHKIANAVSEANGTVSGTIEIGAGRYYEEVDISGKNNLELRFNRNAVLYRPDDSSYCIECVNSTGSESTNIGIVSADLRGNGKTGNKELLKFQYTDEFYINNSFFDGNISSTATYQNAKILQCDNFKMYGNQFLNSAGDFDRGTYDIGTATNYLSDDLLFIYSIIF
jgi:hypothetical protein